VNDRKEWLSNKDIIESARMLDWMHRADDQRYIEHNMKSAELIASNFERGMSRASLERIWGSRLVTTVLGHATPAHEVVKEDRKVSIPRRR